MEERYHATTQNRFYPDMSNVNKNITMEAKLISPPTYLYFLHPFWLSRRLAKSDYKFYVCLSVPVSKWKNSDPTGRIFM